MRAFPLFSLLPVVALACGGTDPPADDGPHTEPEQACIDMATAVARASERCGQDYQANYDAFVNKAAEGNCANIIRVRDETSFRETCLPSFTTITCVDLKSGRADPTCERQLLRAASDGG